MVEVELMELGELLVEVVVLVEQDKMELDQPVKVEMVV